jgi:hypothetical protein
MTDTEPRGSEAETRAAARHAGHDGEYATSEEIEAYREFRREQARQAALKAAEEAGTLPAQLDEAVSDGKRAYQQAIMILRGGPNDTGAATALGWATLAVAAETRAARLAAEIARRPR